MNTKNYDEETKKEKKMRSLREGKNSRRLVGANDSNLSGVGRNTADRDGSDARLPGKREISLS